MKPLAACFTALLGIVSAAALAEAAQTETSPGEIVFTMRDGPQANIYRMAADGTQRVLVFKATDPVNGNALVPRWSADMQRILFTAFRDGSWHLFSSTRDGGDVRLEPGRSALEAPKISPDGVHYPGGLTIDGGDLYYTPPGGKRIKLYEYRAAAPKPMPEDPAGAEDAAWSPDRKWVIFSTCGERQYRNDAEPCHLYTVTPDGKTRRDLGPGSAPDWEVASP